MNWFRFRSNNHHGWLIVFVSLLLTIFFLCGQRRQHHHRDPNSALLWLSSSSTGSNNHRNHVRVVGPAGFDASAGIVPAELLEVVYETTDFTNTAGISPPHWKCHDGTCLSDKVWGPCFAPAAAAGTVSWKHEVERYQREQIPTYERRPVYSRDKTNDDLSNLCKPGFLIIGAGKCGTSSLYHYLVDHPRVLPAREKQIHYFKYYKEKPMKWYLQHFPTAKSFLAAGALLTGEASPGYLPYPDVPYLISKRMPGSRIVAVGRNPIERSYSSYRYNYVTPTTASMRAGRINGIRKGQSDEYYQQYLYTFEDMVRAELAVLREFLAPNGTGVRAAQTLWGHAPWAQTEFRRRARAGLPPLVDLDDTCYGGKVNGTVLRKQWSALRAARPDKVIEAKNLHLVQSIVGRSLYVLPLEWWYLHFRTTDIYFMCTEELGDLTGAPMNDLGQFLGLPAYNFSDTVSAGAYNVGGHRGYDKEVSWDTIEEEQQEQQQQQRQNEVRRRDGIPLPSDLLEELADFFRPFNERLFDLTGRRCNW